MRSVVGILFSLWLLSAIHRAQSLTPQPLNMSVTAFDDQYEGCKEEMEDIILRELLAKEKNANQEFENVWNAAQNTWNNMTPTVPVSFQNEYGIAILAYTWQSDLYSNFNKAVRDYKGRDNFPYHSMHFFITQGVRLLKMGCQESTQLYRGISGILFKQKKGQKIRFGQFSSSSMSKQEAEEFGNDTFFTFTSCFGAPIKQYSYFPSEEEVLIPVDEVFEVSSFTEEGGKGKFVLKPTKRRCHHYNCDYIKPGKKSKKCVYSGGTRMISSLAVVVILLCQVIMLS